LPSTLEERLARIEKVLVEVLRKISELEMQLRADQNLSIAGELVGVFNLPAYRALEASRVIVRLARYLGGMDDITRAIIEALVVEGPLTIRGLERVVRRIRGRASRRIIIRKVRELEELGVVEVERMPNRTVVRLKRLEEGDEHT